MSDSSLGMLAAQLKACPARDQNCSRKRVIALWNSFRKLAPENGDEITPAVLAGLLIYDDPLSTSLLPEAERTQLTALVHNALERFHDQTHHKLGKTIAATIKESL